MLVQPLGWEDPLEEGMATHSSILACLENPMDRGAWLAEVHRVTKNRTEGLTITLHLLAVVSLRLAVPVLSIFCYVVDILTHSFRSFSHIHYISTSGEKMIILYSLWVIGISHNLVV